MTLAEKIESFQERQKKIIELNHFFEGKKRELISQFEKEKGELEKKYQALLDEAQAELKQVSDVYRTDLKAWVGFTDGEQANVLDIISMVARLKSHD